MTIFGRFVILATLTTVSGCGASIKLKNDPLPEALVEQWPLTVAVRYDETVRNFVHTEKLATNEKFQIDLGSASQQMFADTLGDMFAEVIEVTDGAPVPSVDLLIEPSVTALEFAIPSQTVTNDFAVWIKYAVKVYDTTGKLQADFPVPAYGKAASESMLGGNRAGLTAATRLALRDASTLLLTRFDVDAGMRGRQLPRRQNPTEESSDEN
ncbi:MAG: hypothetical protein AAGA84_08805 [Pseudomonadota bacterium]